MFLRANKNRAVLIDNFERVKDLKTNKKFDIIMSCKDEKNLCGLKIDGKSVGGYAWTSKGWFGSRYQHISLCPIFFSLETLEEKIASVEDGIQRGDLKYAREALWQKNIGQFFLHEMMHLKAVGQPDSTCTPFRLACRLSSLLSQDPMPSIATETYSALRLPFTVNDEHVQARDKSGPMAYGPRFVYRLAKLPINQGGGANYSSTNADSYAWLANSKSSEMWNSPAFTFVLISRL
jgi:hypothetical protein